MFVFISHLSVPEADRPALERHFRERAHLVDSFPGFLELLSDRCAIRYPRGEAETIGAILRAGLAVLAA